VDDLRRSGGGEKSPQAGAERSLQVSGHLMKAMLGEDQRNILDAGNRA